MEFFNEMEPLLKLFWYIAIPTSLIFIIQMILTFIGVDATDGLEADFDSNLEGVTGPFQFFSLRNLINFFLGFSWSGISFYALFENKTIVIIIAVVVGLAFVGLFFVIIKQLKKLSEDNTFRVEKSVGKTATVYLKIPGKKSGTGKIQISVNGSYKELSAITEGKEIPSGALVKIKGLDSDNILIVETL